MTHVGLHGGDLHVRVGRACYAEIEDLGLSRMIHQDVAGLEVAVDDAFLVRVMNRVTDSGEQLETVACAEVLLTDVLPQIDAAHVLHGEVWPFAFIGVCGSRLIDLGNTRMLQPAQHLRFQLESFKQAG